MSRRELEQLQRDILSFLTRADTLEDGAKTELHGVPVAQLQTVSDLALSKRMSKMQILMPATFRCICCSLRELRDPFARDYPQRSANGLQNAREFQRFILDHSKTMVEHEFLGDLMCIELALVETRMAGTKDLDTKTIQLDELRKSELQVALLRRNRYARLLHLGYDVRPIIEGGSSSASIAKRSIQLVVVPSSGKGNPRVYELPVDVWKELHESESWQSFGDLASIAPNVFDAAAELVEIGALDLALVDNSKLD